LFRTTSTSCIINTNTYVSFVVKLSYSLILEGFVNGKINVIPHNVPKIIFNNEKKMMKILNVRYVLVEIEARF